MASVINVSALTLSAQENTEVAQFIHERIFEQPMLNSIHRVWTGVKMKEQIVFASLYGKTGISDSGCTRPTSGATSTFTEKFWEPARIGDTLTHCQADLNSLFKAYYDKINEYKDLFDITGSDEELFMVTMFSDSAMKAVLRLAWYGDTDVAVSAAAAAGLVAAGDVQYYDAFDGLWKQIFAGVTAGKVKRVTISENSEATKAAQLTLAAGAAIGYFDDVWKLADVRLRNDPNAQFLVTREIFDNYTDYLVGKGENFSLQYTMDGLPSVKWKGRNIISMETVWDLAREDFEGLNDHSIYDIPNRIVLTVPDNIPVGTLNENDMDEVEAWFEKKERQSYMAYGYTLDAKLLEEYMIAVAY